MKWALNSSGLVTASDLPAHMQAALDHFMATQPDGIARSRVPDFGGESNQVAAIQARAEIRAQVMADLPNVQAQAQMVITEASEIAKAMGDSDSVFRVSLQGVCDETLDNGVLERITISIDRVELPGA